MNKNLTDVLGFSARGAHIGIKSKRRDLALVYSKVPAAAAGAFTKNLIIAEPLKLSKEHLKNGRAQALVVTSGNANACTGEEGMDAAKQVAKTTAEEFGVNPEDVVVGATGVIGEPFPTEKVIKGIKKNAGKISSHHISGTMVANAIMTTDTFQKEKFVRFRLGNKTVHLAGIAKGAGMIHPNMATMLAYFFCDADIEPQLLKQALTKAVEKSFNMISIDGDTSTNDMAVILSNGLAGNKKIRKKDRSYEKFYKNLEKVSTYLAKAIVSDGEGATKFVEYRVKNARTEEEARKIVRTVSNSNLVRTALFGRDPNWGRIIAAVGRAGADIDPDKIDIFVGSKKAIQVSEKGRNADFDKTQLKRMLRASRLNVVVDLNLGKEEAVGWGTDFSYEYVRINAEYTT